MRDGVVCRAMQAIVIDVGEKPRGLLAERLIDDIADAVDCDVGWRIRVDLSRIGSVVSLTNEDRS